MLIRATLACADSALQRRLRALLREEDVDSETIRPGKHTWDQILRRTSDLVLVSRSLIPEPAVEAVAALRALPEHPDLLVFGEHEDPEDSARLVAAGAVAVLNTDLSNEIIRDTLGTILDRRRHQLAVDLEVKGPVQKPRLTDFVSQSPDMQRFLDVVRRIVHNDSTLLITGETGVGKEHLARAIHAEGSRSSGPFVALNCGALPETLLESELFGHEEGAFTGANRLRRGRFELAHRGTIFLDEIAEMPIHLQVKLLQVLQTREVQRIGGDSPVHIDVRVFAATNRELQEEMEQKRFRPDLYYRLSVVSLEIPPLRKRREDIPAMVDSYIHHFQTRFATAVDSIAEDALEALQSYAWPGNVRELINIVERAMLLSNEAQIRLEDLPESVRGSGSPTASRRADGGCLETAVLPKEWLTRPLKEVRREILESVERRYLEALLHDTEGRIGETAERAGIQPRSLFEKMRQYGLRKEDFRPYRRRKKPPKADRAV